MLRLTLRYPQKFMATLTHRNYSLMAISPRKQRALPISPMVVNLTQREEELCALVNDFCNEINADQLGDEPVVCRIAGGWVRDKVWAIYLATLAPETTQLLGVDSHDIDIAINTMTGEEFAKSLLDAGKIQSVGVTIMSNPEQSKHLATTRLKILGIEVDLVNLRSESYNKNSRIPSIVSLRSEYIRVASHVYTPAIWNAKGRCRKTRSDHQRALL